MLEAPLNIGPDEFKEAAVRSFATVAVCLVLARDFPAAEGAGKAALVIRAAMAVF